VVKCFEILLLLTVGSETGRLLRETSPTWGGLYILGLLGLFLYGFKQVQEIKDEPEWPDME
jgi:hypothetical protein